MSSEETNGAYTMLEVVADHRNGTPMHVHQNEDEHFMILEGTAHLAYGDKTVDAPAGTNITVSKGIHHAWCNLSKSSLRMLVLFTPGGIDQLFRTTTKGGDQLLVADFDKDAGYRAEIRQSHLLSRIKEFFHVDGAKMSECDH